MVSLTVRLRIFLNSIARLRSVPMPHGALLIALACVPGVIFTRPAAAVDGVVATSAVAPELDPHKNSGSAGALFSSNVFDCLVGINQTPRNGRGRYVPELASSWTVAADGKSIDFTLRTDAVFHNGQPVTAEDVKFSLERAIAPETKNPYRTSWSGNLAGVTVLGPNRVRVQMSRPWAGTLDALAARGQIVPRAYLTKVGDAEFAKNPVGSGAYAFVGWRPGDRIELRAFDRYWGGKPHFDRITWRAVPDTNTRIAMLANGEADFISDVPPSLVKTVRSNGAEVGFLPGGFQRFLFINTMRGGPLADQRVRTALNLAIDRKTIFQAVFGNEVSSLNGPLSAYQIGGRSAAAYPYDPEQAKKLLAEAGYANGFATELVYAAGRFSDDAELLPSLVSYWNKVGVKVTLKPSEYAQWLQSAEKKAYPGMLSFSKGAGIVADPLSAFDRHVLCGSLYSSHCNKALDAIVNSAKEVVDEKKLEEIFTRAQRMAHDDAGQVYLYDLPSVLAWKKGLVWLSEFGPEINGSWKLLAPNRGK